MEKKRVSTICVYITAAAAVSMWTLLAWNYYHGGIPRHHLLADEKLPSFSNAWGAILIPVLTWFLLYRVQKRLQVPGNNHLQIRKTLLAFTAAFLFGALLAAFFTMGYQDPPGYMILSLFPLALFLPVYRAECLLGFVIGMTYTFGAVISTGVGSVLLLLCALIYLLVRPALLYTVKKIGQIVSPSK